MTRFPIFLLFAFFCISFTTQLSAQSVFLREGQGAFSLGGSATVQGGTWNGAGSAVFSLKGKTDLGLSVGSVNSGIGVSALNGSVVVPSISTLVIKDRDGFNLSLDAAYAVYQLNGRASAFEGELNGFSLGTTISQAMPLDSNNNLYPFAGYTYNFPASTGTFSLGALFGLGLDSQNIYSLGPGLFFVDASTAFGFSASITFTGKRKPITRETTR